MKKTNQLKPIHGNGNLPTRRPLATPQCAASSRRLPPKVSPLHRPWGLRAQSHRRHKKAKGSLCRWAQAKETRSSRFAWRGEVSWAWPEVVEKLRAEHGFS